jgi:hypothetical protein
MKKYTYKHKKTGKRIESDKPLSNKDYVLVMAIRDVRMKANEIIKKKK